MNSALQPNRNLSQIRAGAQKREAQLAAIEASPPCARCEMRGSTLPLCIGCTAEVGGLSVSAAMPHDIYIEQVAPLIREIVTGVPSSLPDVEVLALLSQVRREQSRFTAAERAGRVGLAQLEGWRDRQLEFLDTVITLLPCR